MVVERDRKHYADVKCEKQRFLHTLSMIFDRGRAAILDYSC